jgi:SAM-dependent methyltransferase
MTCREAVMSVQSYEAEMQRMFAAVSDLYAEYWGEFFHPAIFEYESEDRTTALERTHRKYMTDLKISAARSVLELACGRGAFSRLMAENTSGDVLGIDISESQLAHARRLQRPNLRFKRHDIMRVDGLGATFDAVAFLDAACYLPDKAVAVRRIRRVMNPGARLLVLEWCRKPGLSRTQNELVLAPFMTYWAVPYLETASRYQAFFRRSGYRVLDVEDLNDRVAPNWQLGYRNALRAVSELSVRDLSRFLWAGLRLGPEGLRLMKEQFPAAIYVKVGFDSGFLRYVYFLVEAI